MPCCWRFPEVGQAAGLFDFVVLLDGFEYRHDIGRFSGAGQQRNVPEDAAMIVAAEVRLAH